jgi:phage terminase large subunit GpA-like protein
MPGALIKLIRANFMQGAKISERGVIPSGTVAVTIGADTQTDGFYYLLACWGRKMETWLPLTGRITGDMRAESVWRALLEIMSTTWLDKEGNGYKPLMSALDVQGDFYPQCLEFVRAYGGSHRIRAVRGYAVQRAAAAAGRSFGIVRSRYNDKSTGVVVTTLDVDIAKNQLANMLARSEPGPGYVHLPCGPNGEVKGGWDVETVAELTAEYRRQSNVRGYTISRWYKRSGRANHRFDCFVYALAALAMSRLKIDSCDLQRIEARNVGKSDEREKQRKRPLFGAQRMIGTRDLAIDAPEIGRTTGFGVVHAHQRKTGFGALPSSGL